MPRIPDASQLGYSVPRTRETYYADQSSDILGNATQQLTSTVARAAGQLREFEDKFNYAQARSALLTADIEARRALESDNDWASYEKKYSDAMAKAREKSSGMIRGRRDRALFDSDAQIDIDRNLGEVRNLAKRKEIDWGRGSLSSLLESNRTAALNAKDEATRAAIIAATQDAINGALSKGYLSEQEAVGHRQRWTSDYAEAYVGMQPAEERVKTLQANKPGAITDYIAPDRRVDLLRQAENEVRIARERAEAERKASMAELRQSLSDQQRDNLVAARLGLPVSVPSKKVLQAAFGEADGSARYELQVKASELGSDVASLQQLPANEIIEKLESYKPKKAEGAADQSQLYGYLADSASSILKARQADPAGYLVQYAPKTQSAWQAFQQDSSEANREQYIVALNADRERLGIPRGSLLPNDYAKAMADELANPASAEKLADMIESEAQRWGDKWPEIHAQIAKDLPDMAAVIGSGISREAAVTLASTSKLSKGQLETMLPPSTKWTDVEDTVKTKFDPVRRSFPAEGARTFQAIENSAMRLAVSYMQAGDSRSDAVDRAYKRLIDDHYAIGEVRDVTFLVPRTLNGRPYDFERVEDQAEFMLENFDPTADMIAVPPGDDAGRFIERARQQIRSEAYWMSTGDGNGLRLYLGAKPTQISYTFEQLNAMATERRAEAAAASERRRNEDVRKRAEQTVPGLR